MKFPDLKFWAYFKNTNGAISVTEAIFMYNACLQVPDEGVWVEMGTAHGKSALVSLMAWEERDRHDFNLLEPLIKDNSFLNEILKNIEGFKEIFGGKTICNIIDYYSTDFLPNNDNYSYIMWDSGDHGEELVQKEKELLQERVIKGGIIVMHDLFSQFTACTRAYEQLIASGKYEPILYDWEEIISYVKENNLESGNKSWHHPEIPFPNFVGAVKRI